MSGVPDEAGLRCQEVVEIVTAYLESALPPDQRERVEEHLLTCPPCELYLEQMRATIALAGRVEPEELSEEAQADLLAAFRAWRNG